MTKEIQTILTDEQRSLLGQLTPQEQGFTRIVTGKQIGRAHV